MRPFVWVYPIEVKLCKLVYFVLVEHTNRQDG